MILRGLNVLDGCSGQRGNVFGVGKCDGGARRKEERKRGGGILCRHAHSLFDNGTDN